MSHSDPPPVSVIVAAHDVADHIAAAIDSLKAQTHPGFEAWVIDDGSTDDTAARAEAAIGGDPRFRLIRQPNRGLSAARNAGLARARCAHIAFLDGDDRFDPRFLQATLAALDATGCDWAASGVMLCYPDGRDIPHSGIHGAPVPVPGPARHQPLQDARRVARLFPSAWNKLYRHDLIGETRFVEGTLYEDHEFYWTLAARSPAIALVPEPLCLHSRDRPGQITARDDEGAFDQLAVLERLAGIVRGSGKDHADEGLARIATRVVHERARVLRQPDRRQRFLAAAGAMMGRLRLKWNADWDDDIDRAPALVMGGVMPLSVVLWGDGAGDVGATLDALNAQALPDFELLVTGDLAAPLPDTLPCGAAVRRIDAAPGFAAALKAGLNAACGRYMALFRPGDLPQAEGLRRWVNGLERSGASLGVSGHECGNWQQGHYRPPLIGATQPGAAPGADPAAGMALDLTPRDALVLDPEGAAKLWRCDRLRALGLSDRIQHLPDALAAQALTLWLALAEGRAMIFPFPAVAIPSRADPAHPGQLAAAIRALPGGMETLNTLPDGWQALILARLMQQRLDRTPSRPARYLLVAATAIAARRHALRLVPGLPVDPGTAPNLQRAIPGGRGPR